MLWDKNNCLIKFDKISKNKHILFGQFSELSFLVICFWFTSSNGRVVRASASGAVDSGWIPSRIKPMTLKLVFTASLLDAQH